MRNLDRELDEISGPSDSELDELEGSGLDALIEDQGFRSSADKLDEIMERLDSIEEMIATIHAAFTTDVRSS